MSALDEADYNTARSIRGLLTQGTYDADAWRTLLGILGRCSAEEVDTLQRYCNEPYVFYVFDWVKAIRRLIDYQHAVPAADHEPHLFELLSALFTNIRPDPNGLSRLEAAIRQFSRQELEILFGADPWLLNLAISIWEYVTGQARLTSYPWNITVPIADLCNARCTFCTSWLDGRELISVEQIDALEPVFRHAVFAGLVGHGEPLAHPKLSEIVDRLTRFLDPRASLYTITNGFLIDRLFDKLTALNLLSYSISLNAASAATHDQVMGLGADGFDTVMRGIRRLIALRDTARPDLRVYITMVVTAQNVHEIANFVRLGNELGVAEIWIRSLLPQGSLIPGLNYHLLSPTLDPDFEQHRAEAIEVIAASRVPVQADPSAWSGEILPQALRDQIGRNPPPIIGREEARRDRQLRDRNEHLYHSEKERFRGRRRNDSGAVVTLSEDGVQFATPVPSFAYAFGLPISDRLGLLQDDETGLLDIDLSVQGGKVGVGLLDVAANVFLDRKFVDAGFDGRLCFELPVGKRCELIVENGENEAGSSSGLMRRATLMRHQMGARAIGSDFAPICSTRFEPMPPSSLRVYNALDPIEDGLNPLGRMPRFACKAVYYNLYINEMFFRVNPCCYMQMVPGFEETRFDGADFMASWNSPAFVTLRERLRDGPLFAACRRCPEKW
jgi:MoaA/NifB/PqqE/SkfB family radical SAM enzyme